MLDFSKDLQNISGNKKSRKFVYYQSYLKYREYVGWILHEDWMLLTDDSGTCEPYAVRERLYCREVKDANLK